MGQNQGNKLKNSLSPYLLQHADNPVNWYPWGEEALQKAREENKLMIISIGYSTCHWCHVMEKECFEDSAVAEIMNENFVCIKVDREEHPEVDEYYMQAMQVMTGGGGWPLNIFALPDGRPIYGTTYLPKNQWITLCKQIAKLYKNNPEKALEFADNLTKALQELNKITAKNDKKFKFPHKSINTWANKFDYQWGGENRVPKFPLPYNWTFLLRYSHLKKDNQLLQPILLTLDKISYGGINDHLAGGFARYSTDEQWKVPHFEKMLYDNALLIILYSEAYAKTKNKHYKNVVEKTINFLLNELYDKETGAFFSGIDADSEGEEGKFYTWTIEEIKNILTEEEAKLIIKFYNLTKNGNFEHNKNVLFQTLSDEEFAKKEKITLQKWLKIKNSATEKLKKQRQKRIRPLTDDKSITSWNALTNLAFTTAYKYLHNPEYLKIARKNYDFIKNNLLNPETYELKRIYRKGHSYKTAVLEDYAYLSFASIKLFEITGEKNFYTTTKKLLKFTEENFSSEDSIFFYSTPKFQKDLPLRKINLSDDVIPNPNAILYEAYNAVALYEVNVDLLQKVNKALIFLQDDLTKYPFIYASWLNLALKKEFPYYEVVISGSKAEEVLLQITEKYLPNVLFGLLKNNDEFIPAFVGRYSKKTRIFVCQTGSCKFPTSKVSEAIKMLEY